MRIDHFQKNVTLLSISNGARLRGKYDITVDGHSFYSMPVYERHARRGELSEVRVLDCFCDIPSRTFPEAVKASLIAGNNEIVLVGVETIETQTMRVNSIETHLRFYGRGPKTYKPGKRTCSLMIDNQIVAHFPVYFPASSSKTPEATVQGDIGEENELLLIEALQAGRECLLWKEVPLRLRTIPNRKSSG